MPPRHFTGAGPEAEEPVYAGQYRLERKLGSGGMGVVHLARSGSGMRLAVKVVHREFAQDPEFRGRFRQEVGAARRVSGAFTAPVVDADPEAELPWMATLYIPGLTLAEHVKLHGPLPAARLRLLTAGLAEALRDIHRVGVVHRDLKPSNVLLAEDGPKVIDFGISRPSDSELRTETGKLIGTPPFMAPEQFRRPREVGPAADIFTLGSVLVHAATGQGPFDSDSPYVVAYQVVHDEPDLSGVPDSLAPLIARCLAKEPESRPTPDELMAGLRAASSSYDTQAFVPPQRRRSVQEGRASGRASGAGEGVIPGGGRSTHVKERVVSDARPTGPRRRRRTTRRGALRRSAAAAAVLALGVLGYAWWPSGPGHDQTPPVSRPTAPRPWDTRLPGGGKGADGALPECVYAPGRLYCVGPGLAAAALEQGHGRVQWSVTPAGGTAPGQTVPPALAGGLLVTEGADGRSVAGLDPASGAVRWTRPLASSGGGFTVAGGAVLMPGAEMTALDGRTGDRLWRHGLPGQSQPGVAWFGDGPAYAFSVTGGGTATAVCAFDPVTGEVRWQREFAGVLTPVGAERGVLWFRASNEASETDAVVRYDPARRTVRRVTLPLVLVGAQAAVDHGVVYLLETGGGLVAVDEERQRWRMETSVSRASVPVVSAGRLYLSAADGRLLVVDVARQKLLGQTAPRLGSSRGIRAGTLPAPVVGGGRVFGAAPDGTVFAEPLSRW